MDIVFGGAFQGKLDYVKRTYGYSDSDICFCEHIDKTLDLTKPVIYEADKWVLKLIENNEDPVAWVKTHSDELKHSIVVFNDISCGVVPIDPLIRSWREANGRVIAYLASKADSVVRIFCGLESRLK